MEDPRIRPMGLSDRRILLTGATSDLGLSIAALAARLGAKLALTGRDPVALKAALDALPGEGHAAYPFDFEQTDAIRSFVKTVTADGPLAGLVWCAGKHRLAPLAVTKPAHQGSLLTLNYVAPIELIRHVCKKSAAPPEGGPSIVAISTIAARTAQPGLVAYGASKAALTSAVRTLAVEYAGRGYRMNTVSPGWVATRAADAIHAGQSSEQLAAMEGQYPLGVGQPEDVANAVCFLLSPASRWITGIDLVLDGGRTA